VLRTALARARPHFEPPTWEAFEGTWLHDRPAPEVAAAPGLAVPDVYVAKSRVLKRLRDEVLMLAGEGGPLDPPRCS
jgi:RNA polymerase sigma-70 factor (ECF subfamily)